MGDFVPALVPLKLGQYQAQWLLQPLPLRFLNSR